MKKMPQLRTFVAAAIVLFVMIGAVVLDPGSTHGGQTEPATTADPVDRVVGENWIAPGAPPPHQDAYSTPNIALMSSRAVWNLIRQTDSAERRVLVALKRPGMARGFFRGVSLLGGRQFNLERAEVLRSVKGLRSSPDGDGLIRLADGTLLPIFSATVADEDTLRRLRQSPSVDFVEPMLVPAQPSDALACGFVSYTPSTDPRAWDGTVRAPDGQLDLVPYSYYHHHIEEAWARLDSAGPGADQGIAVLDTGVSSRQQQFFSRYALFFNRRPHLRLNASPETIDDTCFHGTKVASVAAAPLDGRSVVGIAWKAPLTTVKVMHSPISIPAGPLDIMIVQRSVCDAINLAIHPPDHRPSPRVVSMAFGLTYYSPVIAECIGAAYRAAPDTVFVAAAGSQVPAVTFPANLDAYVLAASMVEISPTGYRLFGRPLTVAYGKEVDFVSASTADGIPAAGDVGNNTANEIAQFRYSSAAVGMYAGIVALAGQYAQSQGWTRSQLMSALRQSASLAHITDYSGEPVESIIGAGIVDAYRATGGARHAAITGPDLVRPGASITLEGSVDAVVPPGGSPPDHFRYTWWVDGAAAGTGSILKLTAPASGALHVSLTVTDTVDNRRLTASKRIVTASTVPSATLRRLYWTSYVADWATFFNGGRHDRVVNPGVLMPHGCSVTRVLGLLMTEKGGKIVPFPGEHPQWHANQGNIGFTVSRPEGLPSNSLQELIHQWHDGFSIVRTKAVYDVLQPEGVNCAIPGVLTTRP